MSILYFYDFFYFTSYPLDSPFPQNKIAENIFGNLTETAKYL